LTNESGIVVPARPGTLNSKFLGVFRKSTEYFVPSRV
jgi:hypothetical protein